MSGGVSFACDEEEDEDTRELRLLVLQFDDLYYECLHRRLIPEEVRDLDKLFAYLERREGLYWVDVSPIVVSIIFENFDVHFPMIRYLLKMLPDNYSE